MMIYNINKYIKLQLYANNIDQNICSLYSLTMDAHDKLDVLFISFIFTFPFPVFFEQINIRRRRLQTLPVTIY